MKKLNIIIATALVLWAATTNAQDNLQPQIRRIGSAGGDSLQPATRQIGPADDSLQPETREIGPAEDNKEVEKPIETSKMKQANDPLSIATAFSTEDKQKLNKQITDHKRKK